ncbi:MAG: hypothetical protein J6D41_04100 [Clostridium sp.]|nr:hypothetical protein [Clostridium sp.]MBP3915157.1 hypothetical protein [Clostridium sp.]
MGGRRLSEARNRACIGEHEYYPRIGFKTCDHFNITTVDGENFDTFMAYELKKDSMRRRVISIRHI